jgi:hypothetical protein
MGDGPGFVVKMQNSADRARTLAAELYVYRLASWLPGLADVLPRPLLVDERNQVLVLEAAPLEQGFEAMLLRHPVPTPDMCGALGRAAATWHGATGRVHLPATVGAGVLYLHDAPERDWAVHKPAARHLARTFLSNGVLAAALREGAASWSPHCLVHGDLKWDNCLLDERTGTPRVRVVDWEMAGLGDPAWDLGCAVAEQVGMALHERRMAPRDLADLPTAVGPAVGALAAGYVAVRGGVKAGLWERVALYAAVRLLHLALECAEFLGDSSAHRAGALVDAARRLLAAREQLASSLEGWAKH